jgi:cell division transport system ATP-binding protein
MTTANPLVELQGATIQQDGRPILREVNLKVDQGEFTYLIGKTGSGKSSLLKTLYAALPLDVGNGRVAGFDLKKLNRKTIPRLRRKMGIVFQDFNLLEDRNVAENLTFALRASGWKDPAGIQSRMMEVLEKVDLKQKTLSMPHQLSGGEQQRVAIARALLNDPVLIIADEPTGNLDPETSDDILMRLRRLAKEQGSAVLFVTHDYRILEHFPGRIIRCIDGKLIEEQEITL